MLRSVVGGQRTLAGGADTPPASVGRFPWRLLGALTVGSALLLAGCGGASGTSTSVPPPQPAGSAPPGTAAQGGEAARGEAPAPARATVRISYPSTGPSSSVIWLALEAGFLQRNGIDAELTYIESASTTLQAMVSGGVDVAQGGGTAPVNGALSGADTVVFASHLNVLPYKVMVDPAIVQPSDLRGKRLGISRFGSSSDFASRYVLKHFGLRPDEDAAIVQVGGQSARVAALKQRGIDGAVFESPYNVVVAREGYRELLRTADMLPYLHAAIFTTRGYLQQHEPAIRQVVRSFVEAIAYMKREREATIQVIAKYTQEDDRAALEEAYDVYAYEYLPRVPYPDLNGVQNILDELALTNPAAVGQDPARFVDDRYVRELDQSGFIAGLYR
jgi:ABC-type nitrate/sulfonate/bicarbonate transport system substrate-binding protein